MAGKTLVVYYSATGNTEKVAKYIAEYTGADMFKITPVLPYTMADLDYKDKESRVSREHNNAALRNVKLTAEKAPGLDAYDTVFIGYPIWWGITAWPVNGFIKANDLTGKEVIPFCTHGGGGKEQSDKLLAQMAGTGKWHNGEAFVEGTAKEKVLAWVKKEGF